MKWEEKQNPKEIYRVLLEKMTADYKKKLDAAKDGVKVKSKYEVRFV